MHLTCIIFESPSQQIEDEVNTNLAAHFKPFPEADPFLITRQCLLLVVRRPNPARRP